MWQNAEVLIPQYCSVVVSISVNCGDDKLNISVVVFKKRTKENSQLYKFVDSRTNFEDCGNEAPELWQ